MQTNNGVESSYLVKPPVIVLWLVFCVIAAVFEKTGIALLFAFLFLLTGSSWLWARASMKQVEFVLKADAGVFPGQKVVVTRMIRNRKSLPLLWAEVHEPCALSDCAVSPAGVVVERRELVAPEETGQNSWTVVYERLYNFSVIRPWRSVRHEEEWDAVRRGILELGSSEVRSGDGFGMCVSAVRYTPTQPKRITVFPQLVDVSVGAVLHDIWDARSAAGGYLTDRTLLRSVRDSVPGDAAKDINMRLLARGQGFKTNLHEIVTPDTVLFILDAASFRDAEEECFEQSVSVLASLIVRLTEHGLAVSLMTPQSKWFPQTRTEPGEGDGARLLMLGLLAGASRQDAPFSELSERRGQDAENEPGRVYYVALGEEAVTSFFVTDQYPAHKTQLLLWHGMGSRAGHVVRPLSDFWQAG
jgi:uncharacterized protein (DUF58 family)